MFSLLLEGPPYITFFVILISFILSFVSVLANNKIIDRRLVANFQREYVEWRTKLEYAKKTGDKKLMAKLEKERIRIDQMRAKVFSQQLKVMLLTFIPFFVVWWLLIPYFYKPAASIPLLGSKVDIPFIVWYAICFMFFHFALSKIFK